MIDFYDGLADDYHLVYADHWYDALHRQGDALDVLIRSRRVDARSLLDCSCGVGTQAIGLSLRGYEVTSDRTASGYPGPAPTSRGAAA